MIFSGIGNDFVIIKNLLYFYTKEVPSCGIAGGRVVLMDVNSVNLLSFQLQIQYIAAK